MDLLAELSGCADEGEEGQHPEGALLQQVGRVSWNLEPGGRAGLGTSSAIAGSPATLSSPPNIHETARRHALGSSSLHYSGPPAHPCCCRALQIPLPPGMAGRTYGECFLAMALSRSVICLGLYRKKLENRGVSGAA